MSYKKIILKCIDDLIYHYKSQKRSKIQIPYVEEEYFLVNSEEQQKLFKEWYPKGVEGKVKFYKSKSGKYFNRIVTHAGLREHQKKKINSFPQSIMG